MHKRSHFPQPTEKDSKHFLTDQLRIENCCKKMKLSLVTLFIAFLPLALSLQVGFYGKSCPKAESIVLDVVKQRFIATKGAAGPALIRMYFHDCFVRGCDASILIDSNSTHQAEKSAGANLGVREFGLIDQIKAKLEIACPQTVSCADIIALASRDAVALAGGPEYNVPTGRRDGLISQASEVNLPGPRMSVSQAQQAFAAKGMSLNDMVVLLGGHTVGFTHCHFFTDRLSNFKGTGAPDPTMRPALLIKLKGLCGSNPNVDHTVFLDQNTSLVFDNEFYNQIRNKRGVLQIDQDLALDSLSKNLVAKLASNNAFFSQSFANAMIKMGNIQVLQGSAGEIRKQCRVFNN
ncbi:hypothetical protein Cgig2_011632 [Carnegiea gigantea]|uniref:Peroxidase n=1 Tax=Carnegiea gigantea TaxID=171969 RepID=A0A9Q1JL00_9CARY|nr:hypothetical protein Cgig2_011632 [Carnegiea gigantea]